MGGKNRWNRKLVSPLDITFCSYNKVAEEFRARCKTISDPKGLGGSLTFTRPLVVSCIEWDPKVSSKLPIQPDLHIKCHDIHSEKPEDMGPTREHVRQLYEFGKNLPDDSSVVVHCAAGISRSSAAALIIMIAHYGVNQMYRSVNKIKEINPLAHPNRLMIKYADELFGLKGSLWIATAGLGSYPNLVKMASEEIKDEPKVPIEIPNKTQ